jgi:spermidine/putrescine transport system substrate-binding protein
MVCTVGCGRRDQRVLHVFNWADYIEPELVGAFEQEYDCRVVIDTFDSNEAMYAKLKAGASGYDLLFPSSYMVKIMHEQGMLEPIDHARIPNLRFIDPQLLDVAFDKGMHHSVPYMISYTGIACLESSLDDFEPSWSMFGRSDLKGRMTMLNDMRETIGAALRYLGYSLNTTDETELEQALDVLVGWKGNLAKYENEQYKSGIASGEFVLVHGYSGDILQVAEENEDIVFALPREGFSIACDDMVIPKGAGNPDLAHAFIDFVHDPVRAAANTEYTQYLCPNTGCYENLSPEARENPALFPPPEVRARGEIIGDLGEDNAKYTRIWDALKAAR